MRGLINELTNWMGHYLQIVQAHRSQIRSVFLGLGVSALGYILVGSLPRSL